MRAWLTWLVLGLTACAPEVEATGVLRQASIYGPDDRLEVRAAPEPWRDLGVHGVAALLFPRALTRRRLTFCEGEVARFRGPSVGEDLGLCASVRFQEQPFTAGCSATLVAPAVLLTASHCVSPPDGVMALRGFALEADGGLPSLTTADVSAVRRVIVSPTQDLALLELATPVPGGRVVPLAAATPAVGDAVTVIGYPNGGPAKVAGNCHVLKVDTRVATNCEVFPGNSGSGLFTADGALTAVVVSTASGVFRETDAGCRVDFVYSDAGLLPSGVGAPQLTMAVDPRAFVQSVCDAGFGSSLCGGPARCGDDHCTDEETALTCPADCPASTCGDGLCGGAELLDCVADCGEAACTWQPDGGAPVSPEPEPAGCTTTGATPLLLALLTLAPLRGRRAR